MSTNIVHSSKKLRAPEGALHWLYTMIIRFKQIWKYNWSSRTMDMWNYSRKEPWTSRKQTMDIGIYDLTDNLAKRSRNTDFCAQMWSPLINTWIWIWGQSSIYVLTEFEWIFSIFYILPLSWLIWCIHDNFPQCWRSDTYYVIIYNTTLLNWTRTASKFR